MNSAALAALVKAKLIAKFSPTVLENVALTKQSEAIAEAVVEHLTATGVISTTVNVVTTCPAGAGTGVGTGTGTIA